MITRLSFLILFIVASFVFAQQSVSGKVKNTDGEWVANASVTVEEPGKDAIIAYAITNSKGEYKVTFTSSEAQVDLKVKAFNHQTTTKSIKNSTQNLDFTLSLQATEIEEVRLKTRLITKKGDTISYDLKSFDTKNDRTLADVLKRMPGIEVNKDGSILYQGQPLSKFYVNGKDLMEGGYGVVNNALPKDAVQKVEVLENHQPVKILQDKVPSDQAAINIKLKKQVTMTGRGEVGGGIADPALWNIKLTPMFFGQKNQWVVNYKTNNMGETVENEGNIFAFGNRWEGRRGNASQAGWLSVEKASIPNLPEKRYLMNNVHFLSANILTNPFKNKEWELKANASYTNNAVERESYSEQYNKQLDISSTVYRDNRLYTNRAKGEMVFSKNAKEGFFKNTTTFNQFWNADRATANIAVGAAGRNSGQSVESPTTNFVNSLSTIIPWKSRMVNVMSYISYQDDHQELRLIPASYFAGLAPGFDEVRQQFNLTTFEANHSATMGFTKKFWTFTPEIGLKYSRNGLDSELFGVQNSSVSTFGNQFQNDLKFINTVPYAGLGVNFKNENWSVGIQLPVNLNNIQAEDQERMVNQDFTKVTFEPSGFIQYSFASFWKAAISGNMSNSFSSVDNLYSGFIMTNPTFLNAMDADNPILEREARRVGARVEYRNPLNNLFFNVNYSLSGSTRNLIEDFEDDGTGFGGMKYRLMDNSSTGNTASVEIGKYFPKFKSNASVSFRNSDNSSDNFRNGTFFVNENDAQNLSFKLNNALFSWMTLDYNFTKGWSSNTSIFGKTTSSQYNHNLGLTLFPIENHSIALNWDQINYSQAGEQYNNGFYDLTYQFAWASKKIDFELKWMNIANQKTFETLNDSATYITLQRIKIRPSQVMFTVKFNFK